MTAPIDLLPWQPIKTAPQDFGFLLVRESGNDVCFARWSTVYEMWVNDSESNDVVYPTHWLDLSDKDPGA